MVACRVELAKSDAAAHAMIIGLKLIPSRYVFVKERTVTDVEEAHNTMQAKK